MCIQSLSRLCGAQEVKQGTRSEATFIDGAAGKSPSCGVSALARTCDAPTVSMVLIANHPLCGPHVLPLFFRLLLRRSFSTLRKRTSELSLMRRVVEKAAQRHVGVALRLAWDKWSAFVRHTNLTILCPALGARAVQRRRFQAWRTWIRHRMASRRLHNLVRSATSIAHSGGRACTATYQRVVFPDMRAHAARFSSTLAQTVLCVLSVRCCLQASAAARHTWAR